MSLGVVVKGPEGVVLAADSRVTLTAERDDAPPLHINFDNATKLLSFTEPHNRVGAVTYGAAVIGQRTAHSFIPELEEKMLEVREHPLKVREYAELLSEFFLQQWQSVMPDNYSGPPMAFIVGGYGPEDAYGKVFLFSIPGSPTPVEQNPGDTNFGMTWGGQLQIASRLIHGYDPALPEMVHKELGVDAVRVKELFETLARQIEFTIPYQVLPLQDCVDLATLMVRTTMKLQNLAVGVRGVGGLMELAVVTRTKGLRKIQEKSITISDG